MNINTIQEINDILKSRIFSFQNIDSYVFNDHEYAILPGDLSLLIRRNYIDWENISPKHKYSVFQTGDEFAFRTYRNEICPTENEFIISVARNEGENASFIITFQSSKDRREWLRLHSD